MSTEEIVAILAKENPRADPGKIRMYADCFVTYQEATRNIEANGAIVIHPRTGAPIENPYLKVRTSAQLVLRKLVLKSGKLWELP